MAKFKVGEIVVSQEDVGVVTEICGGLTLAKFSRFEPPCGLVLDKTTLWTPSPGDKVTVIFHAKGHFHSSIYKYITFVQPEPGTTRCRDSDGHQLNFYHCMYDWHRVVPAVLTPYILCSCGQHPKVLKELRTLPYCRFCSNEPQDKVDESYADRVEKVAEIILTPEPAPKPCVWCEKEKCLTPLCRALQQTFDERLQAGGAYGHDSAYDRELVRRYVTRFLSAEDNPEELFAGMTRRDLDGGDQKSCLVQRKFRHPDDELPADTGPWQAWSTASYEDP